MLSPRLCRAFLLSSILFAAGCVPGVSWLPDSSGFVFTGGKDGKQLLHLDVASGKTRVILDDAKTNSVWPAVSPDGKTIALAELTGKDRGPSKLHIRLVNREGKELLKSAEVEVRKMSDEISVRGLPKLFWRPTGDKILVSADMSTLIFDVKAGTFNTSENIPVVFGHTPIAPDGSGFIVWRNKAGADEDRGMPHALMDWDGKLHTLKADKTLKSLFKEEKKDDAKEIEEQRSLAILTPASFGGHWNGDVAQVSWAGLHIQIDVKNKTMSGAVRKQATIDGKAIDSEYALKDAVIQFVRLGRPEEKDLADLLAYRVRIDVTDGKARRTLIERADRIVTIPSPDRKLVALRCAVPMKDRGKLTFDDYRDRILVLDGQGKVVSEWEGPMARVTLP